MEEEKKEKLEKQETKKKLEKQEKPEKKETKEVNKKQTKTEKTSKGKKEIEERTAVKALVNGFIAYGILLIFIFLAIVVVVTWFVDNHKDSVDYNVLKYSLPTLAAFLIFFLIRLNCRLSTYDLFKDCKIKKDNVDKVSTKMNFFYICVIAFSVCVIIIYLTVRFSQEKICVTRDLTNYSQSESYYARQKEEEIIEKYENNRSDTLMETLIVEMGLLLGLFSLIPEQKRLIEKYN